VTLGLFDAAFVGGLSSFDPAEAAAAYIAAVEAADGQPLEQGVRDAITTFIVGCAQDGIWNAIKASCILAGARTLNGCLVPLVGTAPTNFGFVAADYNRKTGLVGNGSTKYLNSNRSDTADPQNSCHVAAYLSEDPHSPATYDEAIGSGLTFVRTLGSNSEYTVRSSITISRAGRPIGFKGAARSLSGSYNSRQSLATATHGGNSTAASSGNYYVFADNHSGVTRFFSNARLSFYSIGESLNLALLDARVTTLMNALAVAIP